MVEVIIINSNYVREMTVDNGADYFNTVKTAWVSDTILTDEENVEMLPAGYWSSLCYKNKRPVIFRHNKTTHRRGDGHQARATNSRTDNLSNHIDSIFSSILSKEITGDVVLYRSSRTRWSEIKYPLHSEINNTFFIMTGRTGWIDRAYPVIGPEDNRIELAADFVRFRCNLKHRNLNAQKYMGQRAQAAKEFQKRAARVYSMLNIANNNLSWDDEFDEFAATERTGFLMWSEGKVIVWWHNAFETVSPQHIIPDSVPNTISHTININEYFTLVSAEQDLNTMGALD